MRVVYNLKHRYAIVWNFGEKFLTSPFKLVLKVKGSISSTIQENLLLYCRKFSAFVVIHEFFNKNCITTEQCL